MDRTQRFRRMMLRRLLDAAGLALIAAPALHASACGGKVVVDGESSGGEGGGGGAGGAGGEGAGLPVNTGSLTGGTGTGCGLTSTGTSGTDYQVTECIAKVDGKCPNQYQATMYISPSIACSYVVSVDCGPVPQDESCCYLVTEQGGGCPGRPFVVEGGARTAQVERADRGWALALMMPSVGDLSPAVRAALAEAWTADALLEHASIASFSRFALELMALGAPAELLASAHQAALDEVRHARICFALAEGYAGESLAPAAFPLGGSLTLATTLRELAVATAREGCLGETLSAIAAAEQLAVATDPAVRRALSAIAEDESRHAELAWKTVAWTLEQGGDDLHAAVAEVFAGAEHSLPKLALPPASLPAALAAHGRLDPVSLRESLARGLDEVILPCAARLLARPRPMPGALASAQA